MLIYPAVPSPRTVLYKGVKLEIYPTVPKPIILDVRFVDVTPVPPPLVIALMVTFPVPPAGLKLIFVPAVICVTVLGSVANEVDNELGIVATIELNVLSCPVKKALYGPLDVEIVLGIVATTELNI